MLISVSIIEDDLPVRAVYADWLDHAEGFRLLSQYGDGLEAVAALPAEKPDVVLVDINLPGLNGVECVRQLHGLLPDTQFVMITVYEDPDRIFNALEAGATGYLLKQTSCGEMLTALRDVYEGGSPMSSGIARKVVKYFQRPVSPTAPDADLQQLSRREQEVLDFVARGYLYKEIAGALGLSDHTVDTYLRRIYEKLHVHSRAQATALYAELRSGLPQRSPLT